MAIILYGSQYREIHELRNDSGVGCSSKEAIVPQSDPTKTIREQGITGGDENSHQRRVERSTRWFCGLFLQLRYVHEPQRDIT